MGGRLSGFLDPWLSLISDKWVQEIIESGYKIEFLSIPPDRFFASNLKLPPDRLCALQGAVLDLLAQGVVVPVPPAERFQGFYSNLFTVPRKEGKVRPILDLKALNNYVRVQKFRMESIRSVVASLVHGDLMASVDLKDAYLHIPKIGRASCRERV